MTCQFCRSEIVGLTPKSYLLCQACQEVEPHPPHSIWQLNLFRSESALERARANGMRYTDSYVQTILKTAWRASKDIPCFACHTMDYPRQNCKLPCGAYLSLCEHCATRFSKSPQVETLEELRELNSIQSRHAFAVTEIIQQETQRFHETIKRKLPLVSADMQPHLDRLSSALIEETLSTSGGKRVCLSTPPLKEE